MTSGILFALAIGALVIAVAIGLLRRKDSTGPGTVTGDSPNTVAQWTEGETTRLLSSAELPGLYLLRPRFLSKADNVVYLLLNAAFPRHEIFARIRLSDVLQVKIGPQGMERLRAFRKIANQHVGFVVCDRDMTILAIVDSKEPDTVVNPRDQKLEIIEKKEKEALFMFQEAAHKEKGLIEKEISLEKLFSEEKEILKKISALDTEEAKRQLLKRMEIDIRADSSRLIREIEDEAKELADKKAKMILSLAIQRCAAGHSLESTVTTVILPNEEMKGRIIGKDGRNIKTFETLTGVDLVIDETPTTVILSAFDGVRREIAKISLEELIKDDKTVSFELPISAYALVPFP